MTTILEDFYQYYNFTSGLKLIHFLFMPILLFSGIFSLTAIPAHYNMYNLSDVKHRFKKIESRLDVYDRSPRIRDLIDPADFAGSKVVLQPIAEEGAVKADAEKLAAQKAEAERAKKEAGKKAAAAVYVLPPYEEQTAPRTAPNCLRR